jgi:hypothetical protein
VILVGKDSCPRIVEDSARFIETDSMLSEIALGFAKVPFKHQWHSTPFLRFHLKELRHIAEFLIPRL